MIKNIFVTTLLFALFSSIASVQGKTTKGEELVVLSCSGEQSNVDIFTMRSHEKKFNNVVVKIRKVNGEIVGVIDHDTELTKERRATKPDLPKFLRWFEKTSDGIITYGEDLTQNKGPEWNIKLSTQGEFEREGALGMSQRGTCTAQQKAF
jgi:hypothetical protein